MSDQKEPCVQTVISGSFRKHLKPIFLLKKIIEEEGVSVLSPIGSLALNPEDEFVILDTDPIDNPELLQASVFAKMRRSTFLVVANFGGYLGNAAILEIGYAIALGIKILVVAPVLDPNLAPFCHSFTEAFPNATEKLNQLIESVDQEA